jgi:hypothetical protein
MFIQSEQGIHILSTYQQTIATFQTKDERSQFENKCISNFELLLELDNEIDI